MDLTITYFKNDLKITISAKKFLIEEYIIIIIILIRFLSLIIILYDCARKLVVV